MFYQIVKLKNDDLTSNAQVNISQKGRCMNMQYVRTKTNSFTSFTKRYPQTPIYVGVSLSTRSSLQNLMLMDVNGDALVDIVLTADDEDDQNLPDIGGLFNSVNLNLYHYAGNNPIKYTDPNGRADKAKTFIDITSSILFDSMSRENGDRRYISCFTQGFLTTGEQGDKIASRLGTVDTLSCWVAIAILSPIRYHFDKSGNNFTVPEVGSNGYLVTSQNEIKTLNVLLDCYKDDVLFSDFLMDQKALLLYEIDANKKNLYQHFYPLDPFIKSNNGDFLSHENMSLSDWEMMFPERVSTLTDGGKILHHKSVNYIDAYRQYCNEYNRPEKFIEFCKKWRVVYE